STALLLRRDLLVIVVGRGGLLRSAWVNRGFDINFLRRLLPGVVYSRIYMLLLFGVIIIWGGSFLLIHSTFSFRCGLYIFKACNFRWYGLLSATIAFLNLWFVYLQLAIAYVLARFITWLN